MKTIKQAAADFPAHNRIAVTRISRKGDAHSSNTVYRRLR